ncbi:MAG: M23 family metallopeptidase [Ruminococcaceae bacterium]|nr:M23 family metallopeptidase [Oscillospiraceae bacterium]
MKKVLTMFLAACCFFSMNISCFALGEKSNSAVNNIYINQIDSMLKAKGLTEDNIHSLCNQGFTREEQLKLNTSELNKYLNGTFGKNNDANSNERSTYVTVNNIPDDIYGNESGIRFLSSSGMVNGDFYSANNGSWILAQIDEFANYIFFGENAKKYYFLYGEYDSSIGYHKGVDMQAADRAAVPIRTAHYGNVTTRSDYGAVMIYDNSYTYSYVHMSNLTSARAVIVGDTIGKQSNTGTNSIHLHFEVRSGYTISLGDNSSTNYNTSPYSHMCKNI